MDDSGVLLRRIVFCFVGLFACLRYDEQGTVVEGNSHRGHIDILGPRLVVGSVYKLTGYGLQMPQKSYRAASYDRMLTLSPVTSFKLISSPSPTFALNAFEFIQFGLLHTCTYPCPYLTDVISRAISVSRRNHIDGTRGMAKAQVVVLVDAQSVEFSVTLWEDFSLILDLVSLAEADLRKPVVIGLAGLMVSGFNCMFAFFPIYRKTKGSLKCVDVPFDTPDKRSQHVADSYWTVSQLLALLSNPSDLVRVPLNPRLGATGDFNVSRVWGLEHAFDDQPSTNAAPAVPACDPSVSPSSSKRPVADVDDSSGESDDSDVSHSHSPSIATPIPKEVSSLPDKVNLVGMSCNEGVSEELAEPFVSPKRYPLLSTEISKKASSRTKRQLGQSKASLVQTPVECSDLCVSEELSNPGVYLKRSQNKSGLRSRRRLSKSKDSSYAFCLLGLQKHTLSCDFDLLMLVYRVLVIMCSATEELCDPGVSVEQLSVLSTPTPKTTSVRGKRHPTQPRDSTCSPRKAQPIRRKLSLVVSSGDESELVSSGLPCHDVDIGGQPMKTDASLSPKDKCLDTADDDDVPLRVFARRAKRQASSPDLSVQL
ncbi:hypothetical protein LINPERHAP1_LOCUS18750 [Linum perenne]